MTVIIVRVEGSAHLHIPCLSPPEQGGEIDKVTLYDCEMCIFFQI